MESGKLEAEQLAPEDAREVVATQRGQAVDLRDREEFAQGHIPGAVNVPEEELSERVDELSKDLPVIVVCADGERSGQVVGQLRDRGFEAASVKGGMKAWGGGDMPLQPAEDEEFQGPARSGPLGM
jgi:rhodanese-related sulfurtransferase